MWPVYMYVAGLVPERQHAIVDCCVGPCRCAACTWRLLAPGHGISTWHVADYIRQASRWVSLDMLWRSWSPAAQNDPMQFCCLRQQPYRQLVTPKCVERFQPQQFRAVRTAADVLAAILRTPGTWMNSRSSWHSCA